MEPTKELLQELYTQQRLSLKQIGNLIGRTKSSVMWRMRKYNVPRRTRDLTNAHELSKEEITDLYLTRQISQKDIAKQIGRSQCYVRTKMKLFGVKSRDSGIAQTMKRGMPFNDAFFDEWNPEMAYVLGLLFADGNLFKNRIKLQLQEKDKQLILDVAELLGIEYSYIFKQRSIQFGTYSYGFVVCRRDVVKRLNELGLTSNKSKTMLFPDVPYEHLRHFIRGYFDGDGSICISSKLTKVQFSCGSIAFTQRLKEVLSKELNHDVKIHVDRRTTNYNLNFHSTRLGKLFYNYIYLNGSIYLSRKKKVFEDYLII